MEEYMVPPEVVDTVRYNVFPLPSLRTREAIKTISEKPPGETVAIHGLSAKLPKRPYFDFNQYIPEKHWGVFRFEIQIDADEESDISVISDGRLMYSIKCNGESDIAINTGDRWTERFGRVSRFKLIKGINTLNITSMGARGKCSLAITLASIAAAKTAAEHNWLPVFLDKYVYQVGEALSVNRRSLGGGITDVVIEPACGESTKENDETRPRSVNLGDFGVKELSGRDTDGRVYREKIAVLSPDWVESLIAKIRSRFDVKTEFGRTQGADFLVLCDRIRFLMEGKNRRLDRSTGERDLVELIEELLKIDRLTSENPRLSWIDTPGRHFASYESRRLGKRLPYMLFVPERKFESEKLPLCVSIPSAATSRPNFINSYPIDLADIVHEIIEAAEANRMLVIWPFASNEENTPGLLTHVTECVDDVLSRTKVEPRQIFAFGACGAGRDAFLYAAQGKRKLAGVAVHQMTFSRFSISTGGFSAQGILDEPMSVLKQVRDVPVYLSHGEFDQHISPDVTKKIYFGLKDLSSSTVVMRLIRNSDEGYYPSANNQWIDESFSHFRSMVRNLEMNQ